jgi:hypothetical protein
VTSELAGDIAVTPASDHVDGTTKGSAMLACCGTELQAQSNAAKKLGMTHVDEGFMKAMIWIIQLINMNFAPCPSYRLFARALCVCASCPHTYTC